MTGAAKGMPSHRWFCPSALRLDEGWQPMGLAIDVSETTHMIRRPLPALQFLIVTGRDIVEEIRHVFPKPEFPVVGAQQGGLVAHVLEQAICPAQFVPGYR